MPPLYLKTRYREARIRRRRHRHEHIAELRRGKFAGLVRGISGRHEQHLVKGELSQSLFGGDQMGHVDGIERPSHDAQTQAGAIAQRGYKTIPVEPSVQATGGAGRRGTAMSPEAVAGLGAARKPWHRGHRSTSGRARHYRT